MDLNSFESCPSSITPKVDFLDVDPVYSYNEDLICKYTFLDCAPRENDRICIYIVGWSDVKKYEVMEWVSVTDTNKICTVIFNRPSLPHNTLETYQFCYVSGENEVNGASSPFQFVANIQDSFYSSMQHFRTRCQSVKVQEDKVLSAIKPTLLEEKDKEIAKLRREVAQLKKALLALVMKDTVYKDIEEQKCSIDSLKCALAAQQKEINGLKNQVNKNILLNNYSGTNKFDSKTVDTRNIEEKNLFDVGELKELPPFPFQKFPL